MKASFFKDAERVMATPVALSLDWADIIPARNVVADELVLGRDERLELDRELWDSINDPDRKDAYAKYSFVDSYYTVCVLSLRRVKSVSIAANQSHEMSVSVTHSSSLRNSVSETTRIETVLHASGSGEGGSFLAEATVTSSYELATVQEYAEEASKTTTTTLRYEPADYDRDAVTWDLVKTIALYREDGGKTELVGLGDFYVSSAQATYRRGEGNTLEPAK